MSSVSPILVTGGTGYLGSALVNELLARGERVRVIGRRVKVRWRHNPRIEQLRMDIAEPGAIEHALRGVRKVYHLAASTRGDSAIHRRVTIDAAARLFDRMEAGGGGRIVFVSSLGNYDRGATGEVTEVDEGFPLESSPTACSDYVCAKTQSDLLAQKYLSHETVRTTIIRPGLIVGRGMKNPLVGLAVPVADVVLVVLGTLDRPLPLIHIDDAVDGLIRSMESERAVGGIYNLVAKPMPGSRSYLRLYRQLSGDRRLMISLPLHRTKWLLRTIDLMVAAFTKRAGNLDYRLSKFSKQVVYSTARAEADFGFSARVTIETAMREMCESLA